MIRLLDREAEITTRYGGGFVQSIDGPGGRRAAGRRSDWFFYVNGIESAVGAADVRVRGGDRIWWDYRDWTDAMRVPGGRRLVARALRAGRRATSDRSRCASSAWPPAARADGRGVASRMPACEPECRAGRRGEAESDERSASWSGPGVGSARTRRSTRFGAARPQTASSRPSSALPGARIASSALTPQDPARDLGPGAGLGRRARSRATTHPPGSSPDPRWPPCGGRRALLDARDLRDRYAVAAPSRGRSVALPARAGGQADEVAARLRAPPHATRRCRAPWRRASTSARSRSSPSPTRTRSSSPAPAPGCSSPGSPPGPGGRCAAAARWGLGLGVFIVVVNGARRAARRHRDRPRALAAAPRHDRRQRGGGRRGRRCSRCGSSSC